MVSPTAVDGCAGPGGWDVAARDLGIDISGIEIDPATCRTRRAAGLRTFEADVTLYGPKDGRAVDGLVFSPPCTTYSRVGRGKGRAALDQVISAVDGMRYGRPVPPGLDKTTALVLEPLRWALEAFPLGRPYYWIALEQVPPVLPVWEEIAEVLTDLGYSVVTGIAKSEQFGTVATCPVHAVASAPTAELILLEAARLATADPAWTGLDTWLVSAFGAESRAEFVKNRVFVQNARIASATTTMPTEVLESAWSVAALVRAAWDAANDATWRELVKPRLSQALEEMRILPGREGAGPMSVATFGSPQTKDLVASIESSLRRLWADLCSTAKSYTTSMGPQTTMTPATSPCSAATLITGYIIGGVHGSAWCGVCDDRATPQYRRRAVLLARLGQRVHMPEPTHSQFYSQNPSKLDPGVLPWVSMAESLDWGYDHDKVRKIVTPRVNNQSGTVFDYAWPAYRPAPTIAGRLLVTMPGQNANRFNSSTKSRNDGIHVTPSELGILQGFPADYPWQGTLAQQATQAGNAIPVPLAKALLSAVI